MRAQEEEKARLAAELRKQQQEEEAALFEVQRKKLEEETAQKKLEEEYRRQQEEVAAQQQREARKKLEEEEQKKNQEEDAVLRRLQEYSRREAERIRKETEEQIKRDEVRLTQVLLSRLWELFKICYLLEGGLSRAHIAFSLLSRSYVACYWVSSEFLQLGLSSLLKLFFCRKTRSERKKLQGLSKMHPHHPKKLLL